MKNLFKLTITLFLIIGLCYTESADDIRKAACQEYKDESGNDKAEYDAEKVKSTRESISKDVGDKNALKDYMDDKTDAMGVVNDLIPKVVPWIVLFVLSIFSIISYCYCCCCTKCACCCNKKTPYTKVDLMWPLIGSIAFCLYVLISSSIGLGKSGNFMQDYYMLKCSIFSFLADFIVGNKENPNQTFIGLIGLNEKIQDIIDNFTTKTDAMFNHNDWLYTPTSDTDNYYNNNVVPTNSELWKPSDSAGYNASTADYYNYLLDPIQQTSNGQSPQTRSKFYTIDWQAYTTVYDGIVTNAMSTMQSSLTDTNKAGQDLATEGFQSALQSGLDSISSFQKSIDDAVQSANDSTGSVDDVIPIINLVFTIYFVIPLVFSLIGLAFTVLFIFKTSNCLRIFLNFVWFFFILFTIIGFLLSSIFQLIVTVGYQGCDIMNKVMTDYAEFQALGLLTGDSANYIKTCKEEYGGDGKILKDFGVQAQLDQMRTLNTEMANTTTEFTNQSADFDNIIIQIEAGITNLASLKQDGSYTAYDDSTQQFEIDLDVLSPTFSCTNDSGRNIILQSGSSNCDSYATYTAGSSTCLNIQSYAGVSDPCGNAGSYTTSINWASEKNTLVGQTQTALNNFKTTVYDSTISPYYDQTKDANGELVTQPTGYISKVYEYMDRLTVFLTSNNEIFDSIETLVTKEVNCLFLGTNLDQIMDSLCVGLMPAIKHMTQTIQANSFGMWFACFFLVFAQHRIPAYAKQLNEKKEVNPEQKGDGLDYGQQNEVALGDMEVKN